MNWHNTLKRLKKNDDIGRSPHSLNRLIVKRKPATLYMAQATRDIVKDIDKVHKEVPGVKKLVKGAGASGGSDIIADGTATSSASGTGIDSRVGSASHISSVGSTSTAKPGDLTVDELRTPKSNLKTSRDSFHARTRTSQVSAGAATPEYNDPVKAAARTIKASPRRSASAMDASFHTAQSGSSSTASSATKNATKQLFTSLSASALASALPAAQVAAINKRSKVGRAKGAASDGPIKPLPKRQTPARGAGGRFLKREGGGTIGRTAVTSKAMGAPGEMPKRRRAPKSTQKADNPSIQSTDGYIPPAPKTKGLNMASAGVGPKTPKTRRVQARNMAPPAPTPAPPAPAPAPPTPAPPTPAAPAPVSPALNWQQFKKANAGKGFTPKRMSEAYKAHKNAKNQ